MKDKPRNLELIWESTRCDWCGSSEEIFLFEGIDRMAELSGSFRVVRCAQCGLVRQNPRLVWDSLQHYYEGEYASYDAVWDASVSWLQRLSWRYGVWKQIRAIERYQRGGDLLDVGCGNGIFLAEAQRTRRWQVTGIEPNEQAANHARRIVQAPIYSQRFAEIAVPSASFDVVTMWNVLEHLPEPVNDLRHAHALLRPGGLIVLAIPNLASLAARVFGPCWLGWELPRHLYMFPHSVLNTILAKVGFRVREWSCLNLSYATLASNLKFWSQTWPSRYARWSKWMLRWYYTPITRMGLLAPLWVLDRLKLSTVINVFAQKV